MDINEIDKEIKQATHIPVLVKIFELTKGDVLEIGSGYFSTTLLRWLCQMSKRKLVSYESSNFWYQKAIQKPVPFHEVIKVENWDDIQIERPWEMAFIDHAPDERRYKEIKRLAKFAQYIIIHDSNLSDIKSYGYEKIWDLFKYRYDYTKLNPNTTVVSNFHNLEKLYET